MEQQYRIGDKVRMTTRTWGEAITDRKGKVIPRPPHMDTYVGVVKYVGPECSSQSSTVVRCSGGNVELKLNSGFSFYPKYNGPDQVVEIIVKPHVFDVQFTGHTTLSISGNVPYNVALGLARDKFERDNPGCMCLSSKVIDLQPISESGENQ